MSPLAFPAGPTPDVAGRTADQPTRPEGQSSRVILAARPLAQPLRVGPGFIRAGFHATGQGLGEHQRGGGLQSAAEQVGGAGRLESQGPPVLAIRADLGEFHLALRLLAQPRGARPATSRIPGLPRYAFTSSAVPPRTFTDSPGNCGSRR
jgi:hypothetical protein